VGGGAPRLAARGLELDYIRTTVTDGIPGTAMAAFGPSMPKGDMAAVVAYVGSLNGATESAKKTVRPLSADAARGQSLFSEAPRGFARCSTCHSTNGIGIAVAAPVSRVPLNAAALKSLATPAIATATWAGETMPVLVVAKRTQSIAFYDLTSAPPVLRTVAPAEVKITDGSSWRHASVLGTYTDAQLNSTLAYLRGSGDK